MPDVARSGAVAGAHGKQHVDLYRKVALRRTILRRARLDTIPLMGPKPLAAWIPYCGDGDLAVALGALLEAADLLERHLGTD